MYSPVDSLQQRYTFNSSIQDNQDEHNIDNTPAHFVLRPLEEKDRFQIQQLHEEIFPVKYTENFYDNAVKNMSISGHALYSRIVAKGKGNHCKNGSSINNTNSNNSNLEHAVWTSSSSSSLSLSSPLLDPAMQVRQPCSMMEQLARNEDLDPNIFQHIKIYDTMEIFISKHPDSSALQDRDYDEHLLESGHGSMNGGTLGVQDDSSSEQIVACIIGAFFNSTHIKDETIRNLLVRNITKYPRIFYIMTLGTTESFRNHKLGTKLVKDCLEMVKSVSSCGVVYLHVITYNHAAIKFYETLGFYRMQEIKGPCPSIVNTCI
jgi:ribosomal protein S18 acetylase RimI-like enzyme